MSGYQTRAITSASATAVTDAGATEHVVLTLTGIETPGRNTTVNLIGVLNITVGTNGVAVVVKVRRGTTTSGVEVGTSTTDTGVATDKYTIPIAVTDTLADSAGASYVVTVTETSASADGTVNYVSLGGYMN